MKQKTPISTWVRLAVLTGGYALQGYVTVLWALLVIFLGTGYPLAAKLLLILVPVWFTILASALLIADWRSWAIFLPIQAVVYFAIYLISSKPVISLFGLFAYDAFNLSESALCFVVIPEFAALQALGFGIKCLIRRVKAKEARPTPEETHNTETKESP